MNWDKQQTQFPTSRPQNLPPQFPKASTMVLPLGRRAGSAHTQAKFEGKSSRERQREDDLNIVIHQVFVEKSNTS